MKNSQHTTQIGYIGGFIVIVVIAFAAYYVRITASPYRQAQPEQTIAPSQEIHVSPTIAPIASPSSNITMNWKRYSDNKGGYSLKYPRDWTIDLNSEGCGPVFYPPDTKKVWLTVCGPYIDKGDTPEVLADRYGPGKKLLFREKVKVDNHMGIRQELVSEDSGFYNYAIEVFIGDVPTMVNDGKNINEQRSGTMGIYYYIQDKSKLDQAKVGFNDILATFMLK